MNKPIEYRGYDFLVRRGANEGWFVDIGRDDIWEPAGRTRQGAIGYAKTVIDGMVDATHGDAVVDP